MVDPVTASILTAIISSVIGGGIITWLKRKWKKNDMKTQRSDDEAKAIVDIQKSIWRLNKTVLIIAKILDDQTAKNHPQLTSSLEDIATELLKESE